MAQLGMKREKKLMQSRKLFTSNTLEVLDCSNFLLGGLDALGGELHGHKFYFIDPENALLLIFALLVHISEGRLCEKFGVNGFNS